MRILATNQIIGPDHNYMYWWANNYTTHSHVHNHIVDTNSHALTCTGQFWNVPVSIHKYTYMGDEELYLDIDQLYVVTVTNPNTGSTRRFIAEFGGQVWDLSNKDCLYAGNIQGGRLGDIDDASVSDSVVEGRYSQYIVDGLFDHDFDYFRFNAEICV